MNRFLLDTNVPSELIRVRPDPNVSNWVYAQEEQSLYLSAVSIGELRRGLTIMPQGKRRNNLEQWLDNELIPRFKDRVLSFTEAIANRWGILDGQRKLKGMPLAMADGMIAATAIEHDLILVTRNVNDFTDVGVALLNPWNVP